jgi:hydrogenase nickel incorporation protein HypA/HybF
MHETSIAQSIIDIAAKQLQETGRGRAIRISVKVGHLSSVVPESLSFAFRALARGTAVETAELAIHEVAGTGVCRACGARFPVDSYFVICEKCGSPEVEIDGGDDLSIESMEVE